MSANQAPAGPIRLLTAPSPETLNAGSKGLYDSSASSRINARPASTQNADSRSPRIRGTRKVSVAVAVLGLFKGVHATRGSVQGALVGLLRLYGSNCA